MIKITLTIVLITIIMIFLSLNQVIKADNSLNDFDVKATFEKANELYNQGNYFDAISIYENIINKGIKNGNIYFNLANSYLKNEQLGKAILNYKNAQIFQPRDVDIERNLNYALELTKDQISTEEAMDPMLRIIFFWYYTLNLPELIILTITLNLIVCITLIVSFFYKNEILKGANFIAVIILIILTISSGVKIYNNDKPSEGVIVVKEVDVKCANGSSYENLFTLHEGTPFKISQQIDEWYKIELSNGQKGWLYKDSIGLVNAKN